MACTEIHTDPEESKQWEGAFEGLTADVNWRLSGYRNDIDNMIDYNPHTKNTITQAKYVLKVLRLQRTSTLGRWRTR